MDSKRELMQFISKYRHDWLNDLQIIKGYLTLGKLDDIHRYIDRGIIRAREESRLSNLGDTDLAYFLLTYNWRQNKIILETEVEGKPDDVRNMVQAYPFVHDWLKQVIHRLEAHCEALHENRLFCSIYTDAQQLSVSFELQAKWSDQKSVQILKHARDMIQSENGTLVDHRYRHCSLAFDISVKKRVDDSS